MKNKGFEYYLNEEFSMNVAIKKEYALLLKEKHTDLYNNIVANFGTYTLLTFLQNTLYQNRVVLRQGFDFNIFMLLLDIVEYHNQHKPVQLEFTF